jgi:hypothetical protein
MPAKKDMLRGVEQLHPNLQYSGGGQHFSQNCNILICMPSCGHTLSINNPVHKHLHFRCFKTQDKIVQYTSIYAFDASKHKAKRDRKISLPGKR